MSGFSSYRLDSDQHDLWGEKKASVCCKVCWEFIPSMEHLFTDSWNPRLLSASEENIQIAPRAIKAG